MLHPRLTAPLLALALAACTSHEAAVTTTVSSVPTPEPARADIKAAVASVQLIQNCPDPPDAPATNPAPPPPPAAPAAEAPIVQPVPGSEQKPTEVGPGPTGSMQKMAAGASAYPGGGGWSPPCTQSTVQLSLTNSGDADGQIHITEIRMLDATSKQPVGKIVGRKPMQWSDEGGYRPWDEHVAPGQTLKVGYHLGDPDPGEPYDPGSPPATRYILEIDVAVDGRKDTVRSGEFVREPVHMIVT